MRKRMQAEVKRNRKRVEDRGSLEKLVAGVMALMVASWMVEKSSIQFWRSRMLRKKSLDISDAGLTVRGGARGGPAIEYWESGIVVVGDGGGGWRVRKAGTRRKRRMKTRGRMERRYGSRQTKV